MSPTATVAAPVTTTPAAPVDVISTALIGLLGPWGALAALAYRFGAPFVATLISNSQLGADPTVDEWNALSNTINTPGTTLIPERAAPAPVAAVVKA
jgi:hypothetical protein